MTYVNHNLRYLFQGLTVAVATVAVVLLNEWTGAVTEPRLKAIIYGGSILMTATFFLPYFITWTYR